MRQAFGRANSILKAAPIFELGSEYAQQARHHSKRPYRLARSSDFCKIRSCRFLRRQWSQPFTALHCPECLRGVFDEPDATAPAQILESMRTGGLTMKMRYEHHAGRSVDQRIGRIDIHRA